MTSHATTDLSEPDGESHITFIGSLIKLSICY